MSYSAARKRNSKLMSYYVFFMFFWFIILFTVGLVSSIVTPLYFSTKSDQACRRIPAFERLQYYAEEAQRTICFTCNCYFPNSDNFKQYTTAGILQLMKNYKKFKAWRLHSSVVQITATQFGFKTARVGTVLNSRKASMPWSNWKNNCSVLVGVTPLPHCSIALQT